MCSYNIYLQQHGLMCSYIIVKYLCPVDSEEECYREPCSRGDIGQTPAGEKPLPIAPRYARLPQGTHAGAWGDVHSTWECTLSHPCASSIKRVSCACMLYDYCYLPYTV